MRGGQESVRRAIRNVVQGPPVRAEEPRVPRHIFHERGPQPVARGLAEWRAPMSRSRPRVAHVFVCLAPYAGQWLLANAKSHGCAKNPPARQGLSVARLFSIARTSAAYWCPQFQSEQHVYRRHKNRRNTHRSSEGAKKSD